MTALMKLKTLEGHLQDLKGFSKPKIKFEQYETPAHIAAIALYTIQVSLHFAIKHSQTDNAFV